MKTTFLAFALCFCLALEAQEINWITWQEAVELSQTEASPKKIFVDVYTNWCGWCKKMDKLTFQNQEVSEYMNANYYMVKLNAETREDIEYDGKTYKFVPKGRGYHELAASLLNGRMSYPSVVFMDEERNKLLPLPGFQKPQSFMKIAKYFGDDIYKEKDWQEYNRSR